VLRRAGEIKNGNVLEIMERVIVDLQDMGEKVPPPWYDAKHALEKTIQSAAIEAEVNVGSQSTQRTYTEPFSRNELETYCAGNVTKLERAAERLPAIAERLREIAQSLSGCVAAAYNEGKCDLESLERKLTVPEENVSTLLEQEVSDDQRSQIHREMDKSLQPYRGRMSSGQISQLEKQYLQKRVFEAFEIPRLSLFYLT
jgi:hypothetical protein